jgi:hypothetical protein
MALSQDLRDRVLGASGTVAAVAARFGVSVSYVVKARARLRDAGEASARPQRGRLAPRLAGHEEALRAEVARRPSATCEELRAWAGARTRLPPRAFDDEALLPPRMADPGGWNRARERVTSRFIRCHGTKAFWLHCISARRRCQSA